jgi:hypothetical protein
MTDLDQQKKIIDVIRQCQRNWDLSKDIPQEHLDHLIYIATHSPSKQDEAFYNLHVITNKDLIQELLNYTFGFSVLVVPNEFAINLRNTQMGANAYFLWVRKDPITRREFRYDGIQHPTDHDMRVKNAYTMIGISMGLVAYAAGSLGYKTGFNTNHMVGSLGYTGGKFSMWKSKLGIPENEHIAYGLGIGFPQEGRARNDTDEIEFRIGKDLTESTLHNSQTEKIIESEGKKYVVPRLFYPTFSEQEKDVTVFLH